MSNELIDECLSALEKKIDALLNLIDQQTQRTPHYLNYNGGQYFQPTTLYRASRILFGGHMKISPLEVKIFKVKEAQVTIIKNKSNNFMMKSYFMPY